MSRRRFFVDRFTNGTAVLAGDAAHHLGRVLRAEPGQLYELSDGREIYLARLERVSRDAANFALLEPLAAEPESLRLALLVAVVKFDRFEWALEKATELGVAVIVPLAAERSDKALLAAALKRAERWRKILQESAQQARCLRPPALQELARPAEAFRRSIGAARILLSERPGALPLREVLRDAMEEADGSSAPLATMAAGAETLYLQGGSGGTATASEESWQLSLAVGPEGGWTDREIAVAGAAGFREAALGRNILRTETAAVAALAAAQLYAGAGSTGRGL